MGNHLVRTCPSKNIFYSKYSSIVYKPKKIQYVCKKPHGENQRIWAHLLFRKFLLFERFFDSAENESDVTLFSFVKFILSNYTQ